VIYTEEIPEALADERLDRVVALVTGWSRSAVRPLIEAGRVTINSRVPGERVARVRLGDIVVIDLPEIEAEKRPEPSGSVEVRVLHEDSHVIVVDKVPGQVVHPGAGHIDDTLVNGLLHRYPELESVGQPDRPGIVHRLDRDTSGLLIVARTQVAYDFVVAELAARRVTRGYEALALGHVDSPRGVIDAPIGRSRRSRVRMAVTTNGKPARTHYEQRSIYHEPIAATWYRCRLDTGRTHQIRVHLAAIGTPVIGDPLYGRADTLGGEPNRTQLHAAHLRFRHPVDDRTVEFRVQLPEDMLSVLSALGEPDPAAVLDVS